MRKEIAVLNSKEIKELKKTIYLQWGADFDADYAVLKDTNDRIYFLSKDICLSDLSLLKVNKMGLYVGKYDMKGFRLSIEGCQMIGEKAKKNVIDLDEAATEKWVCGNDINIGMVKDGDTIDAKHFLILRNKNKITDKYDYVGCGKRRDKEILNLVSKNRRIKV